MKHVIDASFIAAVVLPDESSEEIADLAKSITRAGATAPSIWPWEISNLLLMAERRKRFIGAELTKALDAIDGFQIQVEPSLTSQQRTAVLSLARKHSLTVYDAAYLELTIRLSASIASLDKSLIKAAKAEGVTLAF